MTRGVVKVRDGVRIHHRRLGQGPAMVLLHGYRWTPRCEHVEGYPIANSGQNIPEEQPAAVIDAIVTFCAEGT